MIDSHAHLTDDRLLPDVDGVVARAHAAGVEAIVTIGTRPDDWRTTLEVARRFPGVYATLGIHPHAAELASDPAFAELRGLLDAPEVVGLGETGLDYFYDNAPREAQRAGFLRHLELSRETGLPVVVHSRSADDDLRDILSDARGVRGVLHCFAGGKALLERALEVGWYISFSGMITFKKYEDQALVRAVPGDRVLVETDSPYLAPVPHRGKTNEPAFVPLVAARNTRAFYGLEG